MESANREESRRCLEKAKESFNLGDINYARKLALKSIKLCSSQEAEDFIDGLSCDKTHEAASEEGGHSSMSDKKSDDRFHCSSPLENSKEKYTTEQVEAVRRVLCCEDYYEVLEVSRDATDTQLKKQYKRLALALHPDKNRAPKSDEAFKAISKAYATLSDPTHRNHYDRFGEDGLHQQADSPADVSPDDLFRMFFGDREFFYDDGILFTNRNVFQNHRGFHGSSGHFHSHRHHRHTGHRRQDGGNFFHLCQILPIMLIVLVSLFSSLFNSYLAPPASFSLRQNSEYPTKRMTKQYKIPYFVKANFDMKNVKNTEREVVEIFVWELKEQCRYDRSWGAGTKSKACRRLKEIIDHR